MADPFTLVALFMQPNTERERWTLTQVAWRALARRLAMIPDEDDRDDTWPVTKRPLGVADGIATTIGIQVLEGEDPLPLESLVCDVGPSSLLSKFAIHRVTTDDAAFDEHFTARANDDAAARELLGDGLRAALQRLEGPFHFRYERGVVRLSWSAVTLEANHLEAVLGAVLAACQRRTSAPYR